MTPSEERKFIEQWETAAQAAQAKYGVLASITLAQAILESGWGKSRLAAEANNFFGIKTTKSHPYVEFLTSEFIGGQEEKVIAPFRRYDTPAESFDDHARLLAQDKRRYGPAMKVANDPIAFALQLQLCGYSTNKAYPTELCRLIDQFDLTRFDAPTKEGAISQ